MAFSIVATPIGNLEDISARALAVLKSADLILAEDTRRTQKLLTHYHIAQKVWSFHKFNEVEVTRKILELLQHGKNIALVSDAGTPTISDPGTKLIAHVRAELPNIPVIPIPGPSAITAALSVSGFESHAFVFLGYPPHKRKKRAAFFGSIVASAHTHVFLSTPHGITRDLADLQEAGVGERPLFVAREMTKHFESYYRGTYIEVLERLISAPQKGEYTVVVSEAPKP